MDFKLRLDPGALVNLDAVKGNSTGVQVTDSDLIVNLGSEFSAQVSRTAIDTVKPMDDPRPEIYFPMGLSAAAQALGRETVCIVTSYDGLVEVDFNQEVQGEGRPVASRTTGSMDRQAGDYNVPSALATWGRVIGIIVALVVIWEAVTHGLILWVVVALVLLIVAAVARMVITSLRERNAQRNAVALERAPVPFRRLIVSVEDPQGLIAALNQRGAARSAS